MVGVGHRERPGGGGEQVRRWWREVERRRASQLIKGTAGGLFVGVCLGYRTLSAGGTHLAGDGWVLPAISLPRASTDLPSPSGCLSSLDSTRRRDVSPPPTNQDARRNAQLNTLVLIGSPTVHPQGSGDKDCDGRPRAAPSGPALRPSSSFSPPRLQIPPPSPRHRRRRRSSILRALAILRSDRTAPGRVRRCPRAVVALVSCALRLPVGAVYLGSIALADFLHQTSHKGQEPRPLDRWGHRCVAVHRQQTSILFQLTGVLRHSPLNGELPPHYSQCRRCPLPRPCQPIFPQLHCRHHPGASRRPG